MTLDHAEIHFYGKVVSLADIQSEQPGKVVTLHQEHGDLCVSSDVDRAEEATADAHFTHLQDRSLLIKTADCLPIFVLQADPSCLLAVHAGWRGIANNITLKSITAAGVNPKSSSVVVGPHIQKSSFLVRSDALDSLKRGVSIGESWSFFVDEVGPDQYRVDLAGILRFQLLGLGFPKEQFFCSTVDVHSSSDYWSYRRDGKGAGRNLSVATLSKQRK